MVIILDRIVRIQIGCKLSSMKILNHKMTAMESYLKSLRLVQGIKFRVVLMMEGHHQNPARAMEPLAIIPI